MEPTQWMELAGAVSRELVRLDFRGRELVVCATLNLLSFARGRRCAVFPELLDLQGATGIRSDHLGRVLRELERWQVVYVRGPIYCFCLPLNGWRVRPRSDARLLPEGFSEWEELEAHLVGLDPSAAYAGKSEAARGELFDVDFDLQWALSASAGAPGAPSARASGSGSVDVPTHGREVIRPGGAGASRSTEGGVEREEFGYGESAGAPQHQAPGASGSRMVRGLRAGEGPSPSGRAPGASAQAQGESASLPRRLLPVPKKGIDTQKGEPKKGTAIPFLGTQGSSRQTCEGAIPFLGIEEREGKVLPDGALPESIPKKGIGTAAANVKRLNVEDLKRSTLNVKEHLDPGWDVEEERWLLERATEVFGPREMAVNGQVWRKIARQMAAEFTELLSTIEDRLRTGRAIRNPPAWAIVWLQRCHREKWERKVAQ